MRILVLVLAVLAVGCARSYTLDRVDGRTVGNIDVLMTPFGDTLTVSTPHGKTVYECNWVLRANCWEAK